MSNNVKKGDVTAPKYTAVASIVFSDAVQVLGWSLSLIYGCLGAASPLMAAILNCSVLWP